MAAPSVPVIVRANGPADDCVSATSQRPYHRPMDATRFDADGLVGWVTGDGPPVLLLHGGPGLSASYVEPLADELADGYRVAWYQQRGLAPSTTERPYTVQQHVSDVATVLDRLGWRRAMVLGHSWGGHLGLHVAVDLAARLHALVSIDPLGGVGDGGAAPFEAEMMARTPEGNRAKAEALDQAAMAGQGSEADALESLRLVWPAYYADPSTAPDMPDGVRMSVDAYSETWSSVEDCLPALPGRLRSVTVPALFVHGARSPMPLSASTDTADAIPGAVVEVVPGAGHFIWHERPGAVRSALDRFAARVLPA